MSLQSAMNSLLQIKTLREDCGRLKESFNLSELKFINGCKNEGPGTPKQKSTRGRRNHQKDFARYHRLLARDQGQERY